MIHKSTVAWICVSIFLLCFGGAWLLYESETRSCWDAQRRLEQCRAFYDVIESCRFKEKRGGYKVMDCLLAQVALNERCR